MTNMNGHLISLSGNAGSTNYFPLVRTEVFSNSDSHGLVSDQLILVVIPVSGDFEFERLSSGLWVGKLLLMSIPLMLFF